MQQAIEFIKTTLKAIYPDTELNSIASLLLSKITGFGRTELILNKNTKISANQRFLLEKFVEQLKTHSPIQYVLGETEFYGLPFKVNENVLIPRPETEELVDWVHQAFSSDKTYKMLDIGTGSGCIAISLKSIFPKSEITAFDISEGALQTARENAKMNSCVVDFQKVDILNPTVFDKKWDLIVSNPPYIPEAEKSDILPNVLNFEPHTALFVTDKNPLLFYESIGTFAKKHLNKGGMLFFEIHRDYGQQTVQLLNALGFKNIILRKDISGNDRMVRADN